MPDPARPEATATEVTALGRGRPITHAAAVAAHISPDRLDAAVAAGTLLRLRHGVYVASNVWADADVWRREVLRIQAAALTCPDAAVSDVSAAVLHNLAIPWDTRLVDPVRRPDSPVHLTHVGPAFEGPGVVVHRRPVHPADVTAAHGVRVTSVLRTALDLAVGLPLPQALVALDAAVRIEALDRSRATHGSDDVRVANYAAAALQALDKARRRMGRRVGIGAVRRAMGYVDPQAESGLESYSRGVFVEADLPPQAIQAQVRGASGSWFRADALWDDAVIGEADGAGKLTSLADLRAEKRREDDLRAAGFVVVRWTTQDIRRQPRAVVDSVRAARSLAASLPPVAPSQFRLTESA